MKIGIIVAMDKELALLLPLIENKTEVTTEGYTLICGQVSGKEVCVTKCGIGKVNAALACSAMIRTFSPDLVINTGVAGGTGAAEVLDVVLATSVAYHDVWCGPGTEPGQAAGFPPVFECAPAVIAALQHNLQVKRGLMASGDIFVDTPETVRHILELYPSALGCDMESGALAQTCAHYGVEFACLRVISDTPGRVSNNGAQYESFWVAAPQETFGILRQIIAELQKIKNYK